MRNWLRNFFSRKTSDIPQENPETGRFIWCLVGNIIEERLYGQQKELRKGTKHFSAGTKVFCFPVLWGDGYQKIKVIGLHKKSKKYICIIMDSDHITNWRMQKIYKPQIVELMLQNGGWDNTEKDRENIEILLESLLKRAQPNHS